MPETTTEAQGTTGIMRTSVTGDELAAFDWQEDLRNFEGPTRRWGHVTRLQERATEVEAGSPKQAAVLRLLSAVISMHLLVNTSKPFVAGLQMSNGRSAAPEDLDERDLAALTLMADQAQSPWLKARLADAGLMVARQLSLPGWQLGGLAARAYLDHAQRAEDAHPVEQRESLQRAMELGWRYLKKDESFRDQLWATAMKLLQWGLANAAPGVSVPIAMEIVERRRTLAAEAAALFEQQAEILFVQTQNQLAADTFREAAKLWHAAKDSDREQATHQRSAEALIALARGPGQAMLQADWLLEAIAILRRSRGDRIRIRDLQGELAEIRSRIKDEMVAFSHPFDVSDLVAHVQGRMTAKNLHDALLQLAFLLSSWTGAARARERVMTSAEQFAFSSMFSEVTYDEHGVPVALTEAFDASNDDELEKRMVKTVAEDHSILAQVVIPHALDFLQVRFEPTMADIHALLRESPFTPVGHEWSLARGLLAGLNYDWYEAAVFLIPQAEPLVRAAFKRRGLHTLSQNEDGAEEEKSLNELLSHPDVSAVLAPDIVLELKTLLTHKSGHNLRNRYGHGLIRDENLANVGTVALWWTMLRLLLWPFRERARELLAEAPPVATDGSATSLNVPTTHRAPA